MGFGASQGLQRIHWADVWIYGAAPVRFLHLRPSKRSFAPQEVSRGCRLLAAGAPEAILAARAHRVPRHCYAFDPRASNPSRRLCRRLVRDGCGAPFFAAGEDIPRPPSQCSRHFDDVLVCSLLGAVSLGCARDFGFARNRNPALELLCLHLDSNSKSDSLNPCGGLSCRLSLDASIRPQLEFGFAAGFQAGDFVFAAVIPAQ